MLFIYMTLHIKVERNQISGAQGMNLQKLSNFLCIFSFPFLQSFNIFELHKNNLPVDQFLITPVRQARVYKHLNYE